jgi:hypothetical protein
MTVSLSRMADRVYRRRRYRRFYNPMWGLFGDRTPGPAGTFYWRNGPVHSPHWSILDQVLVRPALIDHLTDLEILDNDGQHVLVAGDGAPDKQGNRIITSVLRRIIRRAG